jgi:uncharacterized protein (DUF58 family)
MAVGEPAASPPWYWRIIFPQRTIRPTRDGWWCLFAALGLGVAAVNTGNNLAYLLCSMLLAIITVSGVLSDQSLRGVRLLPIMPDEVYAGRPALFGATVTNGKRRLPSYSVAVEILGPGRSGRTGKRPLRRTLYLPRLAPGEERLVTWEATLPGRGRRRLPGLRLVTRFPFGLFVKMGPVRLEAEVLVFPAVRPIEPDRIVELGGRGDTAVRRRGRGHDLYDLRPYRPGDDPRLVHWRASAKVGALTVRELEEDAALDTRLVLDGPATDPVRLEEGLSEAASLAAHLIRTGAGVEVIGPRLWVPRGHGRGHELRILAALALYEPGGGSGGAGASPASGGGEGAGIAREIRIALP